MGGILMLWYLLLDGEGSVCDCMSFVLCFSVNCW